MQGTLSSTGGGTVTMSSGWFGGPDADFGEMPRHRRLDFAPHADVRRGYIASGHGSSTRARHFAASGGPLGTMYNSGTINFAAGQFVVEKGSDITNLPGGVINFKAPVTFVTEAIDCRIDNQGLIVVNAGNSTMDLATPYPYDGYVEPRRR